MRRPADRRVRRLQGRRRSDLRAVRAGPLRRVHHRGDLRPAGVPPRRSGGRNRPLLHSVAVFPERAHLVGAYSLGKAQRVIALIRKAGYDRPIYLHGALESITRYYASNGIDLGELRPCSRREQGRACRRDRALPAVVAAGPVDAALPRSGALLRLGLDAGARPRPPARRRTAAGDLRSRRLGRTDATIARHRRIRNLGHARPGGRAGALEPRARPARRGRSPSSATATRTRATAWPRQKPGRKRHEQVRRTARSPGLRTRAATTSCG